MYSQILCVLIVTLSGRNPRPWCHWRSSVLTFTAKSSQWRYLASEGILMNLAYLVLGNNRGAQLFFKQMLTDNWVICGQVLRAAEWSLTLPCKTFLHPAVCLRSMNRTTSVPQVIPGGNNLQQLKMLYIFAQHFSPKFKDSRPSSLNYIIFMEVKATWFQYRRCEVWLLMNPSSKYIRNPNIRWIWTWLDESWPGQCFLNSTLDAEAGMFAASYSEHCEQCSMTWLGERICVFLVGNWASGYRQT